MHEFLFRMFNLKKFKNPIFKMGRFNKLYITCLFLYLMEFKRSVSVVTHKLIELNKTCMDAILKALCRVLNENRINELFNVIKQLKYESKVKTITSH